MKAVPEEEDDLMSKVSIHLASGMWHLQKQ